MQNISLDVGVGIDPFETSGQPDGRQFAFFVPKENQDSVIGHDLRHEVGEGIDGNVQLHLQSQPAWPAEATR